VPYTQGVAQTSTWPGRDPEDITAWTLVQAGHVAGRRFTAALAEVGLTPTQFGALLVLDLEPGLSGGEVARKIAVTPQSVSELIATLAELGLIVRDPSPGRGHRIAVSLTPAGQAALRAASTAVEEVDALGLTEPEAALLNQLLHKVLRAASGWRPGG
jgi:DNA-binding MarR family transcriptional regulator